MIRALLSGAAALALLAIPAAAGAQAYPPAPAIGTPKAYHVPASETFTLPNGMQVTLVPFGLAPKVTIMLRVAAGEMNVGKDHSLASLSGSMLKEGAGSRNAVQIAEAAADMGGGLGVGAGNHSTTISLNVLSARAADAIALIADVAERPTFPASEFGRVKADMLRNVAVGLSQAGNIADYALGRAYYGPDHPYGVIPDPALIQSYTVEQAKAFHDANFGAKRAHLYIAGRYDPAVVKAAITRSFADWAAGPDPIYLPPTPKAGPQLIVVDRPGAPQSTIRVVYPVPNRHDPATLQMEVSNAILGGAFSSRLTTNLREKNGYTYSPYSDVDYLPQNAVWSFNADVTTAVTGASLHETFAEIRRLQGEAPSEAEVAGLRTYLAGIFTFRNSTPSGVLSSLVERDFEGLPADWLDSYVPGVLAVTPDQVRTQAAALAIPNSTIVVVGDLKTVLPQIEAQPELKGIPVQTVTVP
jgi:zinc protease